MIDRSNLWDSIVNLAMVWFVSIFGVALVAALWWPLEGLSVAGMASVSLVVVFLIDERVRRGRTRRYRMNIHGGGG